MRGFAPFRQRRSLICWAEKNCHGRTINFHTTTTNTGGNIIMIIVICFQEFIIASSLSSRIECQSWVSSRWGHNLDKEGHNLFPWKFRCDAQEQLQEHHRKERGTETESPDQIIIIPISIERSRRRRELVGAKNENNVLALEDTARNLGLIGSSRESIIFLFQFASVHSL